MQLKPFLGCFGFWFFFYSKFWEGSVVYGHVSSLIVLCHDLAKHFKHTSTSHWVCQEVKKQRKRCFASFRGKKKFKITEIKQGFVSKNYRSFQPNSSNLPELIDPIRSRLWHGFKNSKFSTGLAQPTEIDGLILGAVGVLESSDFYFFF